MSGPFSAYYNRRDVDDCLLSVVRALKAVVQRRPRKFLTLRSKTAVARVQCISTLLLSSHRFLVARGSRSPVTAHVTGMSVPIAGVGAFIAGLTGAIVSPGVPSGAAAASPTGALRGLLFCAGAVV
jgi:hypothetical protein